MPFRVKLFLKEEEGVTLRTRFFFFVARVFKAFRFSGVDMTKEPIREGDATDQAQRKRRQRRILAQETGLDHALLWITFFFDHIFVVLLVVAIGS